MNRELVIRVLTALGATVKPGGGGWVSSSCPVAFWRHRGGVDRNPSFGVSPKTGYNCFSCGAHSRDLSDLILEVQMLHRKNPNPAVDIKAALELLPRLEPSVAEFEFSDYETLTDADVKAEFFEFPEWWLDSFMAAPDHPYLAKRGITPEVGAALGIRYDSQRSRICFPIRDWNGRLGGLHGRDITGKHELRYYAYDFNGSRNPRIWLGEHHCTLDSPLVLVEGPFDYAKVYGVWPNVLSANMAKVSPYKLERIQDAIQIVTFYDAGVGGDKARQQVQDVLGDSAGVVHLVPDSAERDPGDMTPQEISNYLDSVLGGPFGAASWGIDNPTGV